MSISNLLGAKRLLYKGHYMITIRNPKKTDYVPTSDLEEIILWLKVNDIKFNDWMIEAHGRYKQPHVHALVYTRKPYKGYTKYGDDDQINLYTILWTPITSFRGAHEYINKFHLYQNEQDITEHYYKHHYVTV